MQAVKSFINLCIVSLLIALSIGVYVTYGFLVLCVLIVALRLAYSVVCLILSPVFWGTVSIVAVIVLIVSILF